MTEWSEGYDWLLRAWLAASALAVMAGPVGCLVVWRRMAFFGDTLAHGALLGIGAGLLFQVNPWIGVMANSLLLAVALTYAQRHADLAKDSWLGIFSHSMLAGGLVLYGLSGDGSGSLMGLLMGDVLATSWGDVALTGALALIALAAVMFYCWKALVLASINPGLAMADGLPVRKAEMVFALVLAAVVAVAMQVVGVLLTGAMLLLPAATARFVARTPVGMAAWAVVSGLVSVLLGMAASLHWDIPTGPSIVLANTVLLALFFVKKTGGKA